MDRDAPNLNPKTLPLDPDVTPNMNSDALALDPKTPPLDPKVASVLCPYRPEKSPKASTISPKASTISPKALTVSPKPLTVSPKTSTMSPTVSPKASTISPSIMSPKAGTISPIAPTSPTSSSGRSSELPNTPSSSSSSPTTSGLESPDFESPGNDQPRRRNTTSPKRSSKSGPKSDATPKRGGSSPSVKAFFGNIFRRGSVSQKSDVTSPRTSPGSKSPKKSQKQTSTPSQRRTKLSNFFGLADKPDTAKGAVKVYGAVVKGAVNIYGAVPKLRPYMSSDCKSVDTSSVEQLSPIKNVGEYFVDSDIFDFSVDSRIDYGVIDDDKIIPTFLNSRLCYNAMPKSGKVIALTTDLLIKNAFSSLLINDIRSAPLWDSETQSFVGILTITDFINVLRHYHYNSKEDIHAIENQKIQTWRQLTNVTKPLVKTGPCDSLATAAKMLIEEGCHRLPVIDDKRCSVLFIMTNRRLLQYLHQNLLDKFESSTIKTPSFMKKTIGELRIGTYENIASISPETTVIEVLDIFVERNVSSLPVIEDSQLKDIFAKFDVFALAKEQTYHNLNISISEALDKAGVHEEYCTCSLDESLEVVISRFVNYKLHRIVVTDENKSVLGIISLSDILKYLVQPLDLIDESAIEANDTIEEEAASTSSTGQESQAACGSELETELQDPSGISKPDSPDLSEDFLKLQVDAGPSETLSSVAPVEHTDLPEEP